MGLFNFGKKKKESCGCGCDCSTQSTEKAKVEEEPMAMCDCGNMCKVSDIEAKKVSKDSSVKVLGSGCKKCNDLEIATIEALKILNMDYDIEHVTDFSEIAKFGVMTTPALVVDGKVLSFGKVLKTDEVVELLKVARG